MFLNLLLHYPWRYASSVSIKDSVLRTLTELLQFYYQKKKKCDLLYGSHSWECNMHGAQEWTPFVGSWGWDTTHVWEWTPFVRVSHNSAWESPSPSRLQQQHFAATKRWFCMVLAWPLVVPVCRGSQEVTTCKFLKEPSWDSSSVFCVLGRTNVPVIKIHINWLDG